MLFRFDDFIFHLLFAQRAGPLQTVAVVFSAVGGGWGAFAIVPLFFRGRFRRFAGWLAATLAGTAILVFTLKAIVGRGRPFTVYVGLHRALLDSPTDYSCPSGHAAGSFAFAFFVAEALLGMRPRPPYAVATSVALVLFAACVGVSRIVLGFHFPFDVLAGAALGAAIGAGAGRRFAREARSATHPPR